MTTAGSQITKSSILTQFQTNVRNLINSQPKWRSTAHYFYNNYPLGGYYYSYDSWGGALPLKSGLGGAGSGGGSGTYYYTSTQYNGTTYYWKTSTVTGQSTAVWNGSVVYTGAFGDTTGNGYSRGALRASIYLGGGDKSTPGNFEYFYEITTALSGSVGAPYSSTGIDVTYSPSTASLAANIAATALETALRNATAELSNYRAFTLTKRYSTDAGTYVWASFSAYGNLTDAYRIATGSIPLGSPYGVAAGQQVNAANLDNYVAALGSVLSSHSVSSVAFNEYWCHSSCHSSHSSRTRR